ncbi:type II secretion system protein [Candidatus Daviesbacteria bacterium]|nr:type II secretion system protein [Candidatus Daviesbacteria bacterium]
MKKFLPTSTSLSINKTYKNSAGFTLIELLVVIAIIAVLAVMGMAVFSGLTGRGNDSRRLADIKAISDAYENQRTATMANYGTLALANANFSGGTIPADPITTRRYCINSTTGTTAVGNATVVTAGDGITNAGACSGAWSEVGTSALAANTTFFKVCVLLSNNTDIRCVGSKQ